VKWGDEYPGKHDLSSLRLLGTVGEPINPEAWMWYHRVIGGERCPIRRHLVADGDGDILIAPLPVVTPRFRVRPRSPSPGLGADIFDDAGNSVPFAAVDISPRPSPGGDAPHALQGPGSVQGGLLEPVLQARRNTWVYFAGDGAKRDEEGYLWLLGGSTTS